MFSEISSPLYPILASMKSQSSELNSLIKANYSASQIEIEIQGNDQQSFQNKQITAVISKHYDDILAIARNAKPRIFKNFCEQAHFLIGFPARQNFFRFGSFSLKRVIYKLFQQNKNKMKKLENLAIGSLKKKKIRVSREEILTNAMMIFECFGHSQGLLEFEYLNEEGTGLGPTMEYYTIVIDEIRKLPDLWRKTTNNTLFPQPIVHF